MDNKLKCLRPGCGKDYFEKDNNDNACKYHPGKAIFHDIKKGWTCCNIVVYDWDEFTKIQGCTEASHSNVKQDADFYKSSTIENAQKGIDKSESVKIKSIEEHEKQQKNLEEEKRKIENSKPKEIIKTNTGMYYCGNPGCISKTYNPEINEEGSCKHHAGQPVFHDRKKYWTCCKQEAYDWDDFMKLEPCVVGNHIPKYKN